MNDDLYHHYLWLVRLCAQRWNDCSIVNSYYKKALQAAHKIIDNCSRYEKISAVVSVPWYVIGIIHYREADLDFSRSPAQGDPWSRRSIHIPKNRGPFPSFEAAAIDAFANCPPKLAEWPDWSVGGLLAACTLYNGTAYEVYHDIASPYVWAGTSAYKKGFYIEDGKFSEKAVDQRPGCACLLKALIALGVKVDETELPSTPPSPKAPTGADTPEPQPPQSPSETQDNTQDENPIDTGERVVSLLERLKALFKSWPLWITGGATISSAQPLDNVVSLLHNPAFWFVLMVLAFLILLAVHWIESGKR